MYLTLLNCTLKNVSDVIFCYVYFTMTKNFYRMLGKLLEMSHIQQENGQNCGALSWLLSQKLTYWKTSDKVPHISPISKMRWTVVSNSYLIEEWGLGEGV